MPVPGNILSVWKNPPDGAPCGLHVAPDGAPCGLRAAHDGVAQRTGEWLSWRAAKFVCWAAGPQPVIPAARWAKSPSSTRPVQKGKRSSDVRSYPFHFFPTLPNPPQFDCCVTALTAGPIAVCSCAMVSVKWPQPSLAPQRY